MRHHPFRIGGAERDAWLKYMKSALDSLDLAEPLRVELWRYLEAAAHSLVNSPDY